MEKEVKIYAGDTLDSTICLLLNAQRKGEKVFCNFNGHILHSENITIDSAYLEVTGHTKEEYNKIVENFQTEYAKEKAARKIEDAKYAKLLAESRENGVYAVTCGNVIAGLKFIAENQELQQEDLVNGLLDLGCNFNLEDIKSQFSEEKNLFEGIKEGDLGCGAAVIVNTRDSVSGRAYANDRFLGIDDDESIYNFIRVVTGDDTYTKENIEANKSAFHR